MPSSAAAPIVELARPKINLTLRVLGRRPDGYHELESLVAFADGVGDRLTLEPGPEASVRSSGPFAAGIAGENLILTTLRLVAEAAPGLLLGTVHLEKNLPVASGIGGGSADAAAVLRAVARANPDHAARVDWEAIARRLGADIPVCLLNHAAMMRGIGERLEPVPAFPPLPVVLANPLAPVPDHKTAEVFRRLAAGALAAPAVETRLPAVGSVPAMVDFIAASANDLTAAATEVVPEVEAVLAALAGESRCRMARLSGAGPTCFGLFETWKAADTAADRLRAAHPSWWIAPATLA